MMTLEEAIKHELKVSKNSCGIYAENHKQLAAWLTELKMLRAFKEEVARILEEGQE